MSKVSRISGGKISLGSERSATGESKIIKTDQTVYAIPGQGGQDGTDGTILIPKGDWISYATYDALDMVCHTRASGGDGSAYASVQGSNINHAPSEGTPWWFRVSEIAEHGVAGEDGDSIPGIDGIGVNRNNWKTAKAYNKNDVVFYNGSSFICIEVHTSGIANKPESGAGKWRYATKGGADGSPGPRGRDGKDGQNGTNGQNGADGGRGPTGKKGQDGQDGTNGQNGADGNGALNLAQLTDTEGIGGAVNGEVLTKKANGKWGPMQKPIGPGGPNFNQQVMAGFPGQTMDGWNKGTTNFAPVLDPDNIFGVAPNAIITMISANSSAALNPGNFSDRALIPGYLFTQWQGGLVYYEPATHRVLLKKLGQAPVEVLYLNNSPLYEPFIAHGPLAVAIMPGSGTNGNPVSIKYVNASSIGTESYVWDVITSDGPYSSGAMGLSAGNGYIWVHHLSWGSAWCHVDTPNVWSSPLRGHTLVGGYAVDVDGSICIPSTSTRTLLKYSRSGLIKHHKEVMPAGLSGGSRGSMHWTGNITAHVCTKDGKPHIYMVSPDGYQALWTGDVMQTGSTATINHGLSRDGTKIIAAPIIGGDTPSGSSDFTRGHVLVKLNIT